MVGGAYGRQQQAALVGHAPRCAAGSGPPLLFGAQCGFFGHPRNPLTIQDRLTYTVGMEAAGKRLFAPGTGAFPPALVGREREQAVLSRCLSDLAGGGSPPHDVVLVGPRGNGKTVLLNWFERTCRESSAKLDVAAISAADVPTREALLSELAPTRFGGLLPRKVGSLGWDRRSGRQPARRAI